MQALRQQSESGVGPWQFPEPARQVTNPPDLPHLLALRDERRGEEATSERSNERSPVHHSIT
jgi:hypothetical protein